MSYAAKNCWITSCNLGRNLSWAALVETDLPGVRPMTAAREATIRHSLDELAKIFGDQCEWMLTGGVTIAATLGKFYRDHNDLDIAVPKTGLTELVRVAAASGYQLFHRKSSAHITSTKRLNFYHRIDCSAVDGCSDNRIRLIRTGRSGWRFARMDLLDFLDIYPYEISEGRAISCDTRVEVSLVENRGADYLTLSGRKVPLGGIAYIGKIKQTRVGEKSGYDVQVMKEHGLLT